MAGMISIGEVICNVYLNLKPLIKAAFGALW